MQPLIKNRGSPAYHWAIAKRLRHRTLTPAPLVQIQLAQIFEGVETVLSQHLFCFIYTPICFINFPCYYLTLIL